MSTAATAAAAPPRYHRWPAVLGALAAVAGVAFATGEVMGWPFLAVPMQRWLSASMHRRVSLEVDGRIPASVAVRLLGRIRVDAPLLTVYGPSWADTPTTLRARDAVMSLRYLDFWRAREGAPMRVRLLEAAELDVDLQRRADGRASWRLSEESSESQRTQAPLLATLPFDLLKAGTGTLRLRDQAAALELDVRFTNADPTASPPAGAEAAWAVEAHGAWKGQPLQLVLRADAPLPWIDAEASVDGASARLQGHVGEERIDARTPLSDVRSAALIISRWIHQTPPGPAQ